MVDMNNLMKQAQSMQKKMQDRQEELQSKKYTGSAGGEMVVITLNGKGEIKSIKIDPNIINKDEVEILEDLIITALKTAKEKLDKDAQGSLSSILPPGIKFPF